MLPGHLTPEKAPIKIYHCPGTRSVRIVWLLEELEIDYEIIPVAPASDMRGFAMASPSGKVPVLDDGDTVIFESGAILEYLIETRGDGRLAPAVGTAQRGVYLQWLHFAEATLMPPLVLFFHHSIYRPEAERIVAIATEARALLGRTLAVIERCLADGRNYIAGSEFSGADIMLGYPLVIMQTLQLVGDDLEFIQRYLCRIRERTALQRAQLR